MKQKSKHTIVEWEYHLLNQTEYFADLELGLVFNLINLPLMGFSWKRKGIIWIGKYSVKITLCFV